jgi:hypothetical protein
MERRVILLTIGLIAGFLSVSSLSATNYVIFIHGRTPQNCARTDTDNNYWGSTSNVTGGWTKRFVNYDGTIDPKGTGSCTGRTKLKAALNTYCGAGNVCRIICHSMGCLTTDYLAYIEPSFWAGRNIQWSLHAGSATGGSELANLGGWVTGWSADNALKTGNARAFNHNSVLGAGREAYHVAANCPWYYVTCPQQALLPGYDDGAVSPHSACGHNSTAGNNNCLDSVNFGQHRILSAPSYSGYGSCSNDWDSTNMHYTDHNGTKDKARLCWDSIFSKGTLHYWLNNT